MTTIGPLPTQLDKPWVRRFREVLLHAAAHPPQEFTQSVPVETVLGLVAAAEALLKPQSALVQVRVGRG